ncbi:uncharacterized protein LOC108601408 [Drosophila busckii]|uniref:uncharacterized protein LOC108601408 n=1 Tax=Drosophila busckii TaxID=30019 RepID=UPI00083F2632|nr:uncharacterized protein LOC108601408 [Drosophila busckii]
MRQSTTRLALLLLVALVGTQAEPAGYHYDRPTRLAVHSAAASPGALTNIYTGHQFAPLPTVQPLPPVPALPPLPTARSGLASGPGPLLSRYQPVKQTAPPATRIVSSYVAPSQRTVSYHGIAAGTPHNVYGNPPEHQVHYQPPSAPAQTQPLRLSFGKQSLFSPGESYVANGRQLKQYAVIELIDNDIDNMPQPFLSSSSFNRFRSQPTTTGLQVDSRATALVREQQQLSIQPRFQSNAASTDAIALGSGGLGYIRLPNGNVYLGSGSLGYISGQQVKQAHLDARTRSEFTSDALHFGHGPLGGASNFIGF